MTLAIFDLDNTLIAGDSDHLWGEFLIDQGIVDADGFKAANDGFFQDYQDGRLDIFAYQEFVLGVLKGRPLEELDRLRQRYMDTVIDSIWLPAAEQLIADHRERGHTLMIITATNDFITAPIAARLGVPWLIATQAATDADGLYTGRVKASPVISTARWSGSNGSSNTRKRSRAATSTAIPTTICPCCARWITRWPWTRTRPWNATPGNWAGRSCR